jgi:hypothetical protein
LASVFLKETWFTCHTQKKTPQETAASQELNTTCLAGSCFRGWSPIMLKRELLREARKAAPPRLGWNFSESPREHSRTNDVLKHKSVKLCQSCEVCPL